MFSLDINQLLENNNWFCAFSNIYPPTATQYVQYHDLTLTCTQGTILLSNIAFRARCVAVEVTVCGEGASADDVVVHVPLTVRVVVAVLEALILGEDEQVLDGRSLAESRLGAKEDL